MDNRYIVGPPHVIFKANTQFVLDLAERGLEVQASKAQYWIAEDHKPANWDELRGGIPEGVLERPDRQSALVNSAPVRGS